MKKVAASTQNVRLPAASRRTTKGVKKVMRWVDTAATGVPGSSPKGCNPKSDGRLRMKHSARIAISTQPTTIGVMAARQPQCSIIQAATGRKASCPVAALAVSKPMTRPRRAVNQRFATTAPSTSAVRPVPSPSIRLHNTKSCHRCVACVTIAMPKPTSANPLQMTARRP